MKTIGLNGYIDRGHDGGASLIVDGKLVFSIEEEKIIRQRHAYDSLPTESIKACLEYSNLSLDDIDKFVIGWDYHSLYKMINKEFISNEEMSKLLFGNEKYASKISYINHHIAHAYSTFIPSNYEEALVFIIDGQGEDIATSMFIANRKDNKMELLYESTVSLGYFYTGITKHCGFHSGQEGKTMGLASYGKPIYYDDLKKHIYLDENGELKCSFHIEKVSKDEESASVKKWREILDEILPKREEGIVEVDDSVMPYANLAASAQLLLGDIMVGLVDKYAKKYNISKVCLAGGVALNCPTSSRIEAMPNIDGVFIQPAANDGGISLGAAIYGAVSSGDDVRIEMIPYTGLEYDSKSIEEALKAKKYKYEIIDNIEEKIAELLNEGNIVANFQGRLELGPRALGNRSLLASPEKYEMLVKMNTLKGREVWRPLAPAVLYEEQDKYFDSNIFSPHMTKNFNVLDSKKDKLQAITHVDGTARIQSVTKEYNERFYNIINNFYKLSGIPVVINTSFNVKGEPIVCTPEDAIDGFERMNLDYLVMGNYLVKKKDIHVTIVSYTPYFKDVDDRILKKYLENEGAYVNIVSWDDKSYDWNRPDIVIIRSTWDYHERLDEYVEWLKSLKKKKVNVYNDVDIVLNNIYKDKQIKWLKDNNVKIMDSVVLSNTNKSLDVPEKTLKKTIKKYLGKYYGKKMFVLKPAVSARSYNTYLIDPFNVNSDENSHIEKNYEKAFKELLDKFSERGVILQVFAEGIKAGEYGMVFLNGKFVQAVCKKPGKLYGKKEKEGVEKLPDNLLNFAENIVKKLPIDKVLIARVDAIIEDGEPTLMELELAEPNIYIRQTDGVGLNIYDPDWYIPEVARVGCHNEKLIEFAKNIIERAKK